MHNKLAVTGGSRRFFKGKLCLAGLLMLLFWHLLPIQGLAADGGRQVIRVGYPIQLGMTEVDEQGNYSGYTYEYLEEIAQYTGWDYEFVQVEGDLNESLVTLMDMLEKGEIDLMGGCFTAGRWNSCMIIPPTAMGLSTLFFRCCMMTRIM